MSYSHGVAMIQTQLSEHTHTSCEGTGQGAEGAPDSSLFLYQEFILGFCPHERASFLLP